MSFGPMSSPRQDHYGKAIPGASARFTASSIQFESSATYLRTLFPSEAFSFASPGTKVVATFKCMELSNLDWLGGGGYRLFGLWIHGVQYTLKDSSKLFGSFLPVLFENLSDPITTGREELGMPKLFSDIDITKEGNCTRINCSWGGTSFVDMEFGSLEEVAPDLLDHDTTPSLETPSQPPDNGEFVYRYIPSVGNKGKADAEYAVFIDNTSSTTKPTVVKTLVSVQPRVSIDGRDWKSLPTLCHVATALAEVPVYRIIRAKIEEGYGVGDFSHARRID